MKTGRIHTKRNWRRALTLCLLLAGAASSAAAQTASSSYHASQRDPFIKYKPPVRRVAKAAPGPAAVPDIKVRIDNYKAQKLAAMNLQQAAPKPTTALLLSEVQVKGIFRTPRGYAAMVEATPISLSYVVYPGEQFYDGMLVAIEESRLVFRKQTKWTDGRTVVAVETKPLVQPSVADQLTAQRETQAAAATEEKKNSSDVNTLIEALKAIAAGAAQQQQQQDAARSVGGAGGGAATSAHVDDDNPQRKP